MNGLLQFLFEYSHLGVFLALLATGLGLPIPEDIILITGGVIAEQTDSLLLMLFIGMVGVLSGDLFIYSMGYRYGESLLQRRPFSWLVTPERLRKVRGYYRKYGYWAIFISRFLAGLRATSFLMAGLSHVPLRLFVLADGMAALLSVPLFITIGYYFSDDIQAVTTKMKKAEHGVLIGLGVLVTILVVSQLLKKRGARRDAAAAAAREKEQDLRPGA